MFVFTQYFHTCCAVTVISIFSVSLIFPSLTVNMTCQQHYTLHHSLPWFAEWIQWADFSEQNLQGRQLLHLTVCFSVSKSIWTRSLHSREYMPSFWWWPQQTRIARTSLEVFSTYKNIFSLLNNRTLTDGRYSVFSWKRLLFDVKKRRKIGTNQ